MARPALWRPQCPSRRPGRLDAAEAPAYEDVQGRRGGIFPERNRNQLERAVSLPAGCCKLIAGASSHRHQAHFFCDVVGAAPSEIVCSSSPWSRKRNSFISLGLSDSVQKYSIGPKTV